MRNRAMTHRLSHPARAQRGASLPLALLLFLICAMASSIVLAAGTAAAGRASDLARSDQLYYNVTSAARLFRSELFVDGEAGQGHTVTVMLAQKEPVADGGEQGAPTIAMRLDDGAWLGPSADYNVLERAAFLALFGYDAKNSREAQGIVDSLTAAEDWADWPKSFGGGANHIDLKLSHSSNDLDQDSCDALELRVRVEVDDGGALRFTFFEPGDDAVSAESVSEALLTLACDGDFDVSEPITVVGGSSIAGVPTAEDEYEVRIVNVTWTPSDVEKG